MQKLILLFCFFIAIGQTSIAQQGKLDSLFSKGDTTAILDSLMNDFDKFLDSLTKPRSFVNLSIGIGTGNFSFENKNTATFNTRSKLIISPTAGYFHKSGFGLSLSGFMLHDSTRLNFYQFAISPSYDLIKRSFTTGISYTYYLRKDSVNFYITPIQHELFAYFSYRKWWLRPSVSVGYGWGSRTEYEKREVQRKKRLLDLIRRNNRNIEIRNEESVRDLSVTISVRKDFNWYDVFGPNDNIVFTPVILLNSGTQDFGFNTSYSYNATIVRANSLPGNSRISESTGFAAQSASVVLRGSYLKGKFLVQPQVLFDYYLPDNNDPFNVVFSLTASVSL